MGYVCMGYGKGILHTGYYSNLVRIFYPGVITHFSWEIPVVYAGVDVFSWENHRTTKITLWKLT